MRVLCVLVAVTACDYERGSFGTMTVPDAAIDAAPDAPRGTSSCSASGLTCTSPVVVNAMDCNGGCWVTCQSNAQINQYMADQACTAWGGKLAPLRTADDEACVRDHLFVEQASWIGFEQSFTANSLTEGWSWNRDNQPVSYTLWDAGQPNDANGSENGAEQCAMMNTSGFWHDVPCDGVLNRFSCRR